MFNHRKLIALKAIDTSIGKIPIIGKGEAKSINQRVDSLLDEVFSKDENIL